MNFSKFRLHALHILLLLTFFIGSFVRPAQAQSASIRFDTLSIEDGLSQSTVRAIYQDSQGFMWFGTEDGLNKYDGYNFTIYKHDSENPDSLSDNTITALYQDKHGNFWIGTASGLERFKREDQTFQHFLYSPDNANSLQGTFVNAIVEDSQGYLWIGTTDGGLNRFDPAKEAFSHYLSDPEFGDVPWQQYGQCPIGG